MPKLHSLAFQIAACAALAFFIVEPSRNATGIEQVRDQVEEIEIDRIDQSLSKAIAWSIAQQADDGGWHSDYYGALRGGAAVSGLMLYAISHCPDELMQPHRKDSIAARDFLLSNVSDKGYVTNSDGPDYVTYSTAMLLIANERMKLEIDASVQKRMQQFLIAAQLQETHNYQAGDIDYGGWDLMGWAISPRKSAGTNVSVSACALEAISVLDSEKAIACRSRAKRWLETCRASDGGYFFHPKKNHDGNKAGWKDGDQARTNPRAYGTATCDGLRCQLLLNDNKSKDSIQKTTQKTIKWIETNDTIEFVPGFDNEKDDTGWRKGLHIYYLHSLSQVLPVLSEAKQQEQATHIAQLLISKQTADGNWQNDNTRMREDDPLIATGLAIVALANARKILSEK